MENISTKEIFILASALMIIFVATILLWRKACSSILWRFLFCTFIALIFTPVGFSNGHSGGADGPAIFFILGLFNGGSSDDSLDLFQMLFLSVFFLLPVIFVAFVLFGIWSVILFARNKNTKP